MEQKTPPFRLFSALVVLWLVTVSCAALGMASAGPTKTETQSVDKGSAEAARVRIQQGVGELKVAGGADSLLQATFRYNVDAWKPEISYTVNGTQGDLTVIQPDIKAPMVSRNTVNNWDLQLNGDIPLDLDIQTGAGTSDLNLSSLDLTALRVQSGAGTSTIDLSGDWDHDVSGTIEGGVGELTVKLPANIGVQVEVQTGIGGVNANGLVKNGNVYVNDAYGKSLNTLSLRIQAGVGSINLEVQ
jgi:hypothetical protein